MTAQPPLLKTRMLELSLQCFVLGLFGLVPVLGLPAAIAALVASGRVRSGSKDTWNAARPYLLFGHAMAFLGLLISLSLLTWIVFAIVAM
jgi:hypothetical protein